VSTGIALLYFDLGTRRGWGVSVTPWPHLTPRKDPVPTVQEAGWASGSIWTGVENLAPPPGFEPWTVQPVGSTVANKNSYFSSLVIMLILSEVSLTFWSRNFTFKF